MKTKSMIYRILAAAFAVFLMTVFVSPVLAQVKVQKSPGGYHGELDFPISWKRYYSYAEWTKIMHDLQQKYTHLADIESIGKSRMGRDQYVLTITAKSTGNHADKPAMWVDGAVHGNEVNGVSCSLYLAWYLLTRYDYDEYVYDLVNNCTFYILPGLNVDANDSFVKFPNTPNNPREPYRPEDNDGDGLYDEDQTEDVDGDGELSTMYIEDPNGNLKLSPDKRQFIQVTDMTEKVLRFRRIGSEGYDNDGDGRINEDDIGGPDPNRNYPSGWNLGAGWPYPMSEPCTRNAYEYELAHPNIFAGFHFHNTGRIIMFTTPPAVSTEQTQEVGQQRQRQPQLTLEERLEQMRLTNKYAQLFDRQVAPEDQKDMDAQTKIVTMGARILKNYRASMTGGSGQAQAATYDMLGAFSYLIELWGSPAFDADENGDGRVDDDEYLKWIDVELGGEGWIMPHKVNHPDLGEIWIGGSRKKHTQRTPPARYIEMEAMKNAQFVMYCASQFPNVEVGEIKVTPARDNLLWVDVTVKNDRVYPTFSARSEKLGKAVKDKLIFSSSDNIELITVPSGSVILDPLNQETESETVSIKETELGLEGQQALRFRYLAKMDGSNGWVEFEIISKHGGSDKKRITIRIEN
ncbi:M14 family metallopeptidase [candidate division KSB1 bacterium]